MRPALALLALLLAAAPAAAQGRRFAPEMPSEMIQQIIAAARDNITQARLPDGSPVPAETPAERRRPIIPFAEAARVVDDGLASGAAEACGVEWRERNFRPLMNAQVRRNRSGKQIAFVALLHGVAVGVFSREFQRRGCDATLRARIEGHLTQRWR